MEKTDILKSKKVVFKKEYNVNREASGVFQDLATTDHSDVNRIAVLTQEFSDTCTLQILEMIVIDMVTLTI